MVIVGPLTAHGLGSGRSSPVPMVLSQQQAYTPALQLGALIDVGGRPHLFFFPRHLPFASVTNFFYTDYYSFIDPWRMKGWVGLNGRQTSLFIYAETFDWLKFFISNYSPVFWLDKIYTVFQKKLYHFYFCNFFIREPIFIIFGSNMPEEICNKTYIVLPTSPNLCAPALPCNTSSKSD